MKGKTFVEIGAATVLGVGTLAGCSGSENGAPVNDTTGGLTENQIDRACQVGYDLYEHQKNACRMFNCVIPGDIPVNTGERAGMEGVVVTVSDIPSEGEGGGVATQYSAELVDFPEVFGGKPDMNEYVDLDKITPEGICPVLVQKEP
jgi:hypothetical protein